MTKEITILKHRTFGLEELSDTSLREKPWKYSASIDGSEPLWPSTSPHTLAWAIYEKGIQNELIDENSYRVIAQAPSVSVSNGEMFQYGTISDIEFENLVLALEAIREHKKSQRK